MNDDLNLSDILNVDEDLLNSRIDIVQSELRSLCAKFQKCLSGINPDDSSDDTKLQFGKWMLAETILKNSVQDKDNEIFNRLLYYLYEQSSMSINELLNNYDMIVKCDENSAKKSFELQIIED